jgi:hypothetical protein
LTAAVVSVPVFTFVIRRNRSETAVTIVYFLTNQGAWRDFAETGVQLNLFVWFFKEPVFGVFYYIFVFQFSFHLSFIPAGGSSIGWLSPKFRSFCLSRALLSHVMMVFISVLKPSIHIWVQIPEILESPTSRNREPGNRRFQNRDKNHHDM